MHCPFDIFSYSDEETIDLKSRVYFLSEGTRTEVYFLRNLFGQGKPYSDLDFIIPKEIKKTGSESGLTDPIQLIKKAKEWADESESKNKFDKSIDKIVLVFDTDKLKEDDLLTIKQEINNYILIAYFNPKIEFYGLISCCEDMDKVEKDYFDKGFPNTILENMFSNLTHINSKTKKGGKYIAKNIEKIKAINKYDNETINVENKFSTNMNIILEKLIDGSIKNYKNK